MAEGAERVGKELALFARFPLADATVGFLDEAFPCCVCSLRARAACRVASRGVIHVASAHSLTFPIVRSSWRTADSPIFITVSASPVHDNESLALIVPDATPMRVVIGGGGVSE